MSGYEHVLAPPSPQKCVGQARRTNLVEFVELAPQHLRFVERWVTSRGVFGWFEGFTEVTKQSLDVVSLDDKRAQFEAAAAAGANLNVDLECAFEKLGPWTISTAMGGRMFAVSMRRLGFGLRWRRWHDESS